MSGISSSDKTEILFKKFQGYANTDNDIITEFQENARPYVPNDRIYSQTIPSTAPSLSAAENISVPYKKFPTDTQTTLTYKKYTGIGFPYIIKYEDVQLYGFENQGHRAFYYKDVNGNPNLLKNTIPSNYDSSVSNSYKVILKTSGNAVISPDNYSFDIDAGIITFYGNYAGPSSTAVNQSLPPKITFWRYEGVIGAFDKFATKISIGQNAGASNQGESTVAIGQNAGSNSQSAGAIAIGNTAGQLSQAQDVIAIGTYAGSNFQRSGAVAIGFGAGRTSQQSNSISVGRDAGSINQGSQSVAIGQTAGSNIQGIFSVAIGDNAGQTSQGNYSVALGDNAGQISQQSNAVAIGLNAGSNNQGSQSVAIGQTAGSNRQGARAIAIGVQAGMTSQGSNAIAIGQGAGETSQVANSIAINAQTGIALNPTNSGFYVAPVRSDAATPTNTPLYYTATNEVVKGPNWSQVGANSSVTMNNNRITGLAEPSYNQDAATMNYVITSISNIPSVNDWALAPASGNVNMANPTTSTQQRIINMANPINNQDASTKGYVDGKFTEPIVIIGTNAGVIPGAFSGINRIAIGSNAGSNFQGGKAIAVGFQAGQTSQDIHALAMCQDAGGTSQGSYSIAIGNTAGNISQGVNAISIGRLAGSNGQSQSAIAIGCNAGLSIQNSYAIAIGENSGKTSQGSNSIAIGLRAAETGRTNTNLSAIAIGVEAGRSNQGQDTIAVGTWSGCNFQSSGAVAIGMGAGRTSQQSNSIAIGMGAGSNAQGLNAIAIGQLAGQTSQSANTVVINATGSVMNGSLGTSRTYIAPIRSDPTTFTNTPLYYTSANELVQGPNWSQIKATSNIDMSNNRITNLQAPSVASDAATMGYVTTAISSASAGAWATFAATSNVNMATNRITGMGEPLNSSDASTRNYVDSKFTTSSVRFGTNAGQSNQLANSIAIGLNAGNIFQGTGISGGNAIAIGTSAGSNSQANNAIAIGCNAGQISQQSNAVAIGNQAGSNLQGIFSVAIGDNAGQTSQGNYSVALGDNAGQISQQSNAVAIGFNAGSNAQGSNAIAIGQNAGRTSQSANSIVLNASSTVPINGSSQGFYVNPVRDVSNVPTNIPLYYNTTSNEIVRGPNWSQVNANSSVNMSTNRIINLATPTALTDAATKGYVDSNAVLLNSNPVKIGSGAGSNGQANLSVAIGFRAAELGQQIQAVAIGVVAGGTSQESNAVAIGNNAGCNTQRTNAVAIGNTAGFNNQGSNAIAIGLNAGHTNQSANSIVLNASSTVTINGSSQGFYVAPVRSNVSGGTYRGVYYDTNARELVCGDSVSSENVSNNTSIGGTRFITNAAAIPASVSNYTAFIGSAGSPNAGRMIIGDGTGWEYNISRRINSATTDLVTFKDNGLTTIRILEVRDPSDTASGIEIINPTASSSWKMFAGGDTSTGGISSHEFVMYSFMPAKSNGKKAFTIDNAATKMELLPSSSNPQINIGSSGRAYDNTYYLPFNDKTTIKIGSNAGATNQGSSSVAIGENAGQTSQSSNAVAIGWGSGTSNQKEFAISIGRAAGHISQGSYAVGIGWRAGFTSQGNNAIAIGQKAGETSQSSNSIVLNAQTDTALNASNQGFYVAPVRNETTDTETQLISYNTSSKEIVSSPSIIATVGSNAIGYTGTLHFKLGESIQGRIATDGFNSGNFYIQGSTSVKITNTAGSNHMADFNTQTGNTIDLFNSASTNPTLNIRGTGGTGRVYDTVYNKPAVVAGVPTGTIMAFGRTTAPDGWLVCNGGAVRRQHGVDANGNFLKGYPELFSVISTSYGNGNSGDNSTTFNLPNLVSKFMRGATSPGIGAGSDTITLTANNLPAHSHSITDVQHNHRFDYTTTGYASSYNGGAEAVNFGNGSPSVYGAIFDARYPEKTYNPKIYSAFTGITGTNNNTTTNTPITAVPAYTDVVYIIKT